MSKFAIALSVAAVVAFGVSTESFAATSDQEWFSFEEIFGSPTPPKTTADCARYTTAAVKMECENRVNRGTTFTYLATGDHRKNAEEAAQKYCGMLGKTADVKGLTQDGDMLHYSCK